MSLYVNINIVICRNQLSTLWFVVFMITNIGILSNTYVNLFAILL